MRIDDIKEVRVNKMDGYRNDPSLEIILKRDRTLCDPDAFRYRQYDNIFYAEHAGEVHYLSHNRNDHNGFGGSIFTLRMADDWDANTWRDCTGNEHVWMGGGQRRDIHCHLEGRQLKLQGPWSSGASVISRLIQPIVHVSVMEGRWRRSLNSKDRIYQKRKAQGEPVYEGLFISCDLTLSFTREILNTLAPWWELYEGDYGWYPVLQGESPKNPRKGNRKIHDIHASDEQAMIIER